MPLLAFFLGRAIASPQSLEEILVDDQAAAPAEPPSIASPRLPEKCW